MIRSIQLRATLAVGAIVAAMVLAFALQAGARAASMPVPGGSLDWGVKDSFVAYIEGTIANGEVTPDGVTQNADGSYRFPLAEGTTDDQTGETSATFTGSLRFTGHDEGDGPQLDLTVTNLRVQVAGVTGTLIADVTSKGLGETEATVYTDIVFATLNFSGTPPAFEGASIVFHNVPAVLTADGAAAFAGFYDAGTELDPVTLSFELGGPPTSDTGTPPPPSTTVEPTATSTPAQGNVHVTVSKTTVNPDGDTVTVTGTGFLPELATGTRPPLAGQPAGVYVAFGAFADSWQPSQGAPASARPVYGQGLLWAVPEAARDVVGREASVTLNPDGSFTAVINVKRGYDGALADGNYGIYTYPGSGATQPLFETFTPLSFTAAPQPPATGTGLAAGGTSAPWLLLVAAALVVSSAAVAVVTVRR